MTAGGGQGGTGGGRNFTRTLGPVKNFGTPQNPQLTVDPATATTPGTMSAADYKKVQHIVETVGGVLFTGPGNAFLESDLAAYLAANLYYDGANWLRHNTANTGLMLQAAPAGGFAYFDAAAGANPAVITERARLQALTGGAYTQLNLEGPNGNMLAAATSLHLCANCYFDGTNWQRHTTVGMALRLRIGADTSAIEVLSAPPGANPITAWTSFTLTTAGAPVGFTPLVGYQADWGPYGGGAAPFTARWHRDALGYVHFDGLVTKPTIIGGATTICNIPSGGRPGNQKIYDIRYTNGTVEVRVDPSGNVTWTGPNVAVPWLALDGIVSYKAEN